MAKPTPSFEDFKLNKQLLNAIADKGYGQPTPIQKKAIPLILAGHDLMGNSGEQREGDNDPTFGWIQPNLRLGRTAGKRGGDRALLEGR